MKEILFNVGMVAIVICAIEIVIGIVYLIRQSIKIELQEKKIVEDFISENKGKSKVEILTNYHVMYNNLDKKTQRNNPVDSLWQSISSKIC